MPIVAKIDELGNWPGRAVVWPFVFFFLGLGSRPCNMERRNGLRTLAQMERMQWKMDACGAMTQGGPSAQAASAAPERQSRFDESQRNPSRLNKSSANFGTLDRLRFAKTEFDQFMAEPQSPRRRAPAATGLILPRDARSLTGAAAGQFSVVTGREVATLLCRPTRISPASAARPATIQRTRLYCRTDMLRCSGRARLVTKP